MICVLIITPIPALRAGLRALLSDDPNIQVVGAAASVTGLVDFPAEDGVLMITPEVLGEHTMLEQLARQDGWALLLVGDDPAAATVLARSLPPGRAWGLISTDSGPEALQAALGALAEGLNVVPAAVMANLLLRVPEEDESGKTGRSLLGDGSQPPESLTERETDVLRLAAEGMTNKQIALRLSISEHTVKFHISAIYAKFEVSNRAEAVSKGARWGLIPL